MHGEGTQGAQACGVCRACPQPRWSAASARVLRDETNSRTRVSSQRGEWMKTSSVQKRRDHNRLVGRRWQWLAPAAFLACSGGQSESASSPTGSDGGAIMLPSGDVSAQPATGSGDRDAAVDASTDATRTDANRAVEISSGFDQTCARMQDATIRCWGYSRNIPGGKSSTTMPVPGQPFQGPFLRDSANNRAVDT